MHIDDFHDTDLIFYDELYRMYHTHLRTEYLHAYIVTSCFMATNDSLTCIIHPKSRKWSWLHTLDGLTARYPPSTIISWPFV